MLGDVKYNARIEETEPLKVESVRPVTPSKVVTPKVRTCGGDPNAGMLASGGTP